MKNSLRCASGLLVLCVAATSAMAQARPAPRSAPAGGAVAVIDISKIFKEHPGFRAKLDDMKKDVTAAEQAFRKERDNIKTMVEQLRQFQSGSPNYRQQEERIATSQASLKLKMDLQRKDFMEREAKIYYEVYRQIESEVAYFAQRHGITLVLRYNNIDMQQGENRQKVLAKVNKPVVYQNNIDITYDILDRLRRPTGGQTGNGGTATRPPRSSGGLVPGQR